MKPKELSQQSKKQRKAVDVNTLEKIHALKAGEFDKMLEGTPYGDKTETVHEHVDIEARRIMQWKEVAGEKAIMQAREANAAKLEVTKGVLDEVIIHIHREIKAHGDSDFINPALTLLKSLRDAL